MQLVREYKQTQSAGSKQALARTSTRGVQVGNETQWRGGRPLLFGAPKIDIKCASTALLHQKLHEERTMCAAACFF